MSTPDFESPPVVEVALSVQFNELPRWEAAHLGLLWVEEFKSRLPTTATHPPLGRQVETFGLSPASGVKFEFHDGPPTPRAWFLDPSETQLVQVQADRFVHNWRKTDDDDTYPRYETIRERFSDDITSLLQFIERHDLGDLKPDQCEITYVNHITLPWDDAGHRDMDRVFTFVRDPNTRTFLPNPESIDATAHFVITSGEPKLPIGRLHASVRAGFQNNDSTPIFVFTLTARGLPAGDGVDGILSFLDVGREWIVRGFVDLTTEEMHKVWGRRQ
ncbi:MAG: TIGR04255 family protein [Deltaproteobacteria bacterium]|nr:TIGR04255 family protein [Deltaproteobacteria bacterium]